MSVRTVFSDEDKLFYITFTCFDWLPLIERSDSYDVIYTWFQSLRNKYGIEVCGYVIMPNHVHCILSFPQKAISLNKVLHDGKIYIARQIIKRLIQVNDESTLRQLSAGVSGSHIAKGQRYVVFERGFEAKAIFSRKFLMQKLSYIHRNPVRGVYNLVDDWRNYPHSSAGFYEFGLAGYFEPVHYHELA